MCKGWKWKRQHSPAPGKGECDRDSGGEEAGV